MAQTKDKKSETGEKIAGFEHFQSENKSESENHPQTKQVAKPKRRNRELNSASKPAIESVEWRRERCCERRRRRRQSCPRRGRQRRQRGRARRQQGKDPAAGRRRRRGRHGRRPCAGRQSLRRQSARHQAAQVQAGQAALAGLLESGKGSRPVRRERRRADYRAEASPRGPRERRGQAEFADRGSAQRLDVAALAASRSANHAHVAL